MFNIRDNQLQTLWIARVDYSKNSGVNAHTHNFYQLQLIINGAGTVEINGETFPILSDQCYLFKKNTQHAFRFSCDSITIDFKFELNDELAQLIDSSDLTGPCKLSHIAQLKQLFQLSSTNLSSSNPLLPYRIDVGLKNILLTILQDKQSQEKTQEALVDPIAETDEDFPIVQYLKQHLHLKVNLEEVAKHFGFHPHYLIELFKKKTGTTPIQYLQFLRLEKAKEYLEFTTLSVSEIADRIGLTTPYFSRLCCERLGVPPTQIREQMRTVVGKDIVLEEEFSTVSQPSITDLEPRKL